MSSKLKHVQSAISAPHRSVIAGLPGMIGVVGQIVGIAAETRVKFFYPSKPAQLSKLFQAAPLMPGNAGSTGVSVLQHGASGTGSRLTAPVKADVPENQASS